MFASKSYLWDLVPPFPIHDLLPTLKEKLREVSTVILQAPPGAGKSTILPLALLQEDWLRDQKILLLEPRRLAARSVANRMADLLNETIGETVGYRVRFENKTGKNTRIEVVTEGILTRMLQQDTALEGVGLVIFDEFHERSLHADLALALTNQLQQIFRSDLKIVIMSATLDGAALSKLLNDAPILTSEGRQFPVELIYTDADPRESIAVNTVQLVKKALAEQTGDLLVFLPGTGDILRVQEQLEAACPGKAICPLYGDLSPQKQQEALLPDALGRQKVVLATSIAETSLTIDGITAVVDAGYSRIPVFDHRSGLTRLETVRVSKDAADQRAGRAGRLGPGVCYRMWNAAQQLQLAAKRKPEILEADLAPMLLELAEWGVHDLSELKWLDSPPPGNVAAAKNLLSVLGAIENNRITAKGKQLLLLPTHPRFAHLLLEAELFERKNEKIPYLAVATDLLAILEERDPLSREKRSDLSLRMEVLHRWREKERVNADTRLLERIERLASFWRRLFKLQADNTTPASEVIGKLVATAFPERMAMKMEAKGTRYRLANGRNAGLNESDDLSTKKYIAIAHMDAGSSEGRIFLAAALDPQDVMELATVSEQTFWDKEREMVAAARVKSIGSIVLESKANTQLSEEGKNSVLLDEIRKQGLKLLNWGDAQRALQARLLSLKKWRPDEAWPDVSDAALLGKLEEWLLPYLTGISKASELQKLNLNQAILSWLPYELNRKLDQLAPVSLDVPTGSAIHLNYYADGNKVEMAVRLQEVFGWLDTPTVNDGQIKVLMQLLSPGYKPVQLTQDLRNFWNKTYFEVRKELMGRYPKHHWPENPLEAKAVRGIKRKTP